MNGIIYRTFNEEIKLTPRELADVFCEMDADKQADFFQAISQNVEGEKWDFGFQLQRVVESNHLGLGGALVMQKIGEYGREFR